MHLYQHLGLSLALASAIWWFTRSLGMTLSALFFGVLIDLDHWFDYFAEYGRRIRVRHFFQVAHDRAYRRGVLFLHGWEWVILLAGATWWFDYPSWLAGITLGWGTHLVADQLYNRPRPWGYSLAYRIRHGFDFAATFPPKHPEQPAR